MVREYYASYVANLRSQIDRWALEQVRVVGVPIYIFLPAIHRLLYGESIDATRTPLTAEFDYR